MIVQEPIEALTKLEKLLSEREYLVMYIRLIGQKKFRRLYIASLFMRKPNVIYNLDAIPMLASDMKRFKIYNPWIQSGMSGSGKEVRLTRRAIDILTIIRSNVDYLVKRNTGVDNFSDTVVKQLLSGEEEIEYESGIVSDAEMLIKKIKSNKEYHKEFSINLPDLQRIVACKALDITEHDIAIVFRLKRVIESREAEINKEVK